MKAVLPRINADEGRYNKTTSTLLSYRRLSAFIGG
jgi:hypothetical protein